MRNIPAYFEKVHELKTYPDHKHIGDFVVEAVRPNIEEVLDEVKKHVAF